MVLACKSDLEKRISPSDALSTIQKFAGLVEVSSQTESGKKKMRRSLDLFIKMLEKSKSMFRGISNSLRINRHAADPKDTGRDSGYRNPVSPDALHPPPSPWNASLSGQVQESIQTTALRVMSNGQSTSPSSAENVHPPSPYPMPSHSPNKSSISKIVHAPSSSPPSPTRSRSLSDLLGDSQRNGRPIRTQLFPLQDLHFPGDGISHLPLDRNRSRSIADIAQEDDLIVKLSNASADQPSILPDTLTSPYDKNHDNLHDITPLASPPVEYTKHSEHGDPQIHFHAEVTKNEQISDIEQQLEHGHEQDPEPILIMNTKSRQKDPYVHLFEEDHTTY